MWPLKGNHVADFIPWFPNNTRSRTTSLSPLNKALEFMQLKKLNRQTSVSQTQPQRVSSHRSVNITLKQQHAQDLV